MHRHNRIFRRTSEILLIYFIQAIFTVSGAHSQDQGYISQRLGNEIFDIPNKYRHPRPTKTDYRGACYPDCDFGIQFWLPDLKAPEKDLFFRPEFRPSEANRPNPGPGEFVVKVISIRHVPDIEDPKIDTAETRIEATLELAENLAGSFSESHYEQLTTITSKTAPNGPQRLFLRRAEGSVFIFCAAHIPSAICQGFVDIRKYGVTVSFHFPISEVLKYNQIADGIGDLLEKWKRM